MHCVQQKLINDGLLQESIDIIMSSWRRSTSKKYNTYIKEWIEFCEKSKRDFQNAKIKDGLNFLNHFEHNKNYSTIPCAWSVLSFFINTRDNTEFEKQQIVQKHMKEIYISLVTKLTQVYIHMGSQKFNRLL